MFVPISQPGLAGEYSPVPAFYFIPFSRQLKSNRNSSLREHLMGRKHNSPILKLSDVEPTFRHCQWLYGDGRDREFCCEPVGRGEVWCGKHGKQIYASAAVQKKFGKILEKQMRE